MSSPDSDFPFEMRTPDEDGRGRRRKGGRSGGGKRRRKGGRGPRPSLGAFVAFLLVFVAAGGYMFLRNYASPPDYTGNGTGSVVVRVEKGATISAIAETLEKSGVVKSARAFVQAAQENPDATSIQPGYYQLRRRMKASLALRMMLDPSSKVRARVTIREGRRLTEILARIAEQTDIPREALRRAAKHPRRLGLPSYAKTLEGYLFPATYNVTPDDTARGLLRRMVDEFRATAREVDLRRRAAAMGRSPHEIVTIASLIQGEVSKPSDFRKVSAVVYNRLAKGMPLEFTSTVNYALEQRKLGVSLEATQVQSPYNTYIHEGLPPGPINSPGKRALEAALNPADADFLYFVTTNPEKGITKFTSSYEEFLRFKQQFKRNTR